MSRIFQVFRAGTHTDSSGVERTFTADDLRAIADKYSFSDHPAPIVKGHPQHDDPAYGWVDRFMYEETGQVLYAVPRDLDPSLVAENQAGRFRRVSIALYAKDDKNNPMPGVWYPRHVGILGAAAPAVKGLKAVNFTDNGEGFLMFDPKDEEHVSKFSEAIVSGFAKAFPWLAKKPEGAAPATPDVTQSAEFKELDAKRVELENQLNTEKADKAKLATAARRTEVAAFAEKLTADGKITPAEKKVVTELLFTLSTAEGELTFTEGEGTAKKETKVKPIDAAKTFLGGLPQRIRYQSLSNPGDGGLETIGFTAPENSTVSADAMDLHRRAVAYSEEKKIPYMDAVTIIERGTH